MDYEKLIFEENEALGYTIDLYCSKAYEHQLEKALVYQCFLFTAQDGYGVDPNESNINQMNYECFTFPNQLSEYLMKYNYKLSQVKCYANHIFL